MKEFKGELNRIRCTTIYFAFVFPFFSWSYGCTCSYVEVQLYPWFKFSFLLFQTHYHVIIIHYHTQRQKKRKFEPRIKLNHNSYAPDTCNIKKNVHLLRNVDKYVFSTIMWCNEAMSFVSAKALAYP